mgnify:FL=1
MERRWSKGMGNVMKTILISGVLLIGAGAVFLFWSAGNAQNSYEQSVAEVNNMGVFILETTAYDRELLSSAATTVVSLNTGNPQLQTMVQSDPDFPWDEFQLVLESDIQHLPDLFVADAPVFNIATRLDEQDSRQAEWVREIAELDALRLNTLVRMDGTATVILEVDPISYQSEQDDSSIEWGGLSGTFDISDELEHIKGDMRGSGLSAQADSLLLEIGDLHYRLDGRFGSHDFYTGNQSLVIEGIRFSGPAGDAAEIQDMVVGRVAMRGEAREQDALLSVSSNVELIDIEVADQRVPRFQIGMAVDNLPMEPLAELRDMMQKINSDPVDPIQNSGAMQPQIIPAVRKVLTGQPRIRIEELALDTGAGELHGELDLQLLELPPDMDVPPQFWLTALQGKARVRVSEPLLIQLATTGARAGLSSQYEAMGQELPPDEEMNAAVDEMVRSQLESLEIQGMLLRDGNSFRADLSLEKGELQINGKSLQTLLSGGTGQ